MPDFTIIEAKPWHCGQMARALRAEHREVIARIGIDCHKELRTRFNASSFRRAWLIDGQLAALGGVMGTKLAATGFIWLALAGIASRYPIAVTKEARRQIDEIMNTKREVATTILSGDLAARRFAIFLGFHVSHEGLGVPAHARIERRRLSEFVENDVDSRIPIAGGYATVMGYHHEDVA